MDEEEYLLSGQERSFEDIAEDESVSGEEWSEESSQCSSYYTDSDESSIPEWESYIDENGQLLFIECHPFVKQSSNIINNANDVDNKGTCTLAKNRAARKSTRSKFLRLIRRRDSKRRSLKKQAKSTENQGTESKVTFHEYNEGEVKMVTLPLNPEACKYGRRNRLPENLLGINTSTFPDGCRVMVAGIVPNGNAKNDKSIKIGDWLKSINGQNVSSANLNAILDIISESSECTLELQRVTGVEVTKEPPSCEISDQSPFVKQLTRVSPNEPLQLMLLEHAAAILYLDSSKLTESGAEFEEVIYCYPKPMEANKLCLSRGMFITLNQLLNDLTDQRPEMTSVLLGDRLAHVAYTSFESKLILLLLPDNRVKCNEIFHIKEELLRMLKFTYGSITNCFEADCQRDPQMTTDKRSVELDHFFSRFFTHFLSNDLKITAEANDNVASHKFESVHPVAHHIPLPNEAQMQIDDALNELEACDYREWNDDPSDCQRLFTILGSSLYHSGYLLASHFIHDDLIDVHLFCRQQGLFRLSQTEPIKSMVLWREVFPYSCNRESTSFVIPEEARHYLLLVGSGKDLLAVIMEAGGCTEPPEDNLAPDAFYVEEAQATLAHLQELGISELAQRWLKTNPGSQVTIPQVPQNKRMVDFLGNFNIPPINNSNKDNTSPTSQTSKKTDLTSILKRRNSDQGHTSFPGMSPILIEDTSEDSVSQRSYSEKSVASDEPVLGRRAQREKGKNNSFDGSDDEESDIEDYRDGSQISMNSYDITELRNTLLNETSDVQPMPLTCGKDLVLYHYLQLDFAAGILLSPPECSMESQTLALILNNFRRTCHHIHRIFQNTLRFKNMSSSEMAKSPLNKSMVAVKECGMLFEVPFLDEMNKKQNQSISFWVTGRLFHMPHPKELYVCYKDSITQNLVEIAFKLGISTIS